MDIRKYDYQQYLNYNGEGNHLQSNLPSNFGQNYEANPFTQKVSQSMMPPIQSMPMDMQQGLSNNFSTHSSLDSKDAIMTSLHKVKSKALPIYDPKGNSYKKVPIDVSDSGYPTPKLPKSNEIMQIKLMFDPPIVGTDLKAMVYVLGSDGEQRYFMEQHDLSVKWFRGIKRICCVKGCTKSALLQCLTCVKLKISQRESYFCSSEHIRLLWQTHKVLHINKSSVTKNEPICWNETDGDYGMSRISSDSEKKNIKRGSAAFQLTLDKKDYEKGNGKHGNMESVEALSQYFPPLISNIWAECGTEITYVPAEDDAGRQILAECTLYEKNTKKQMGGTARCWTSPVLPRYEMPPERKFVPCDEISLPNFKPSSVFRVMSYNVLADIYATNKMYPYVHSRFLNWEYRCSFIMAEIMRYRSHVICLQEVQLNHFENYFEDKLKRLNYVGTFKKKTRNSTHTDPRAVDGCAVFYDRSHFSLVQQLTIEYNEAADGLFRNSDGPWKEKIKRLTKDNIAVVCVLENVRTKQRVCIANTHIFWDPTFADVKLWQTLVLCKELQNLKNSANIPIIICGDFNSKPDSAVYKLLTTGLVPDNDPLVAKDKLGIFHTNQLMHGLPFMSAYKMVLGKEPEFTNYTAAFKGCIDYILYSRGTLQALRVLDTYSEQILNEHTALPSPRIASDHLQMVAEFAFPS